MKYIGEKTITDTALKLIAVIEGYDIYVPQYYCNQISFIKKGCLLWINHSGNDCIIFEIEEIYRDLNYPWIDVISDMLDAIYGGELYDKGLPGHGSAYYKDEDSKFTEMFANYYFLKAMCPERIEVLRALTGDRLVDYMEGYMQRIMTPFMDTKETDETRRI